MKKFFQIAIDGSSAVGKTSCGKLLAKKLNFLFIDTGILFRAFTYHCLAQKINFSRESDLLAQRQNFDFQFLFDANNVKLNNQIIKKQVLYSTKVLQHINTISINQKIRAFLTKIANQWARQNNIVMTGRDIGTVMLPHADVKIFLEASLTKRAERRYLQQFNKISSTDNNLFHQVKVQLKARDHSDISRKIAPLKKASNAITIDNSNLTLLETVALCYAVVQTNLFV